MTRTEATVGLVVALFFISGIEAVKGYLDQDFLSGLAGWLGLLVSVTLGLVQRYLKDSD